jgi:predicted metalloprotease with PDZ domain
MVKPLAAIGVVLLVSWASAMAAEPVQLQLKFGATPDRTPTLQVSLTFDGDMDGQTAIALPNEWGGEKKLYLAIREIAAQNAELSNGDAPHIRVLRHAPSARITVTYRVADDDQGPPKKDGGNDYRVQLKPKLVFALGDAIVAQPETVDVDAPARVSIQGLPQGMVLASDLQHQELGRTLTFRDLIESVVLAGDVRVIDAGGGMRLAIHGKIDARDDQGWKDAFTQIATAQRRFWRSGDEPFLVTILTSPPPEEGFTSIGGTGRSDAFAFFTTTNAGPAKLDQILAHEMMHTWVPRRIGAMPEGPDEPLAYWISEGFTDWASMRVLARSRFWSPNRFAEVLNEFLKDHDLSPVRTEPNARIAKDFWNDRNVGDLPYRRGMILGLYFDGAVRQATRNKRDFDDVLWRMQDIAKENPKTPVREAFSRAIADVAGFDVAGVLIKHVDQGVPIDLRTDLFGPCGPIVWIDRAKFHRGFDIEASTKNGNVITGVVKGGPAERAGLRDGMKLVKRSSGEIGNAQVEIAYEVIDGDTPKTLRWMPEGQGRERFRQLKLAQDLTGERETACAQRMGGL